jgi:hypothetical protein
MAPSDFLTDQHRDGESRFWHSKVTVPTDLGDFQVVLEMAAIDDADPPDERMIQVVNGLIEFCQRNAPSIRDIVFGAYRSMQRAQPQELEHNNVPLTLSESEVTAHIASRNLIITRDGKRSSSTYRTRILLVPFWDEEHGIDMNVVNNEITDINDSEYRLVDGELMLD